MHITCLQHVAFEGPAEIATWAEARGHTLETVALYEPGFTHPAETDFLVIMGGPMGVHDDEDHPYRPGERRYIASVIERGSLVLGICLGAQLIADVLGAEVSRGEHTEIGWYPVKRLADAGFCPVMRRLPEVMGVLHWHGDTFAVPERAPRTYASEACGNQAFSYLGGRVIGLQFHLEQNPESLAGLVEGSSADLVGGLWIQSAEEMLDVGADVFAASNEALFTLLDAMSALWVR